jgi:hypothetical protein
MATAAQIEANRRNSQKSTGPRSPAGKTVSRFNALKSGIDAKSMIIPGEDSEELEALAANYQKEFQPASPLEQFLVDTIVGADWQLRRLRGIEASLWLSKGVEAGGYAEAFANEKAFDRLYRRMDAAERSLYRAKRELEKMRKEAAEAAEQGAAVEAAGLAGEAGWPVTPDGVAAANGKLASFLQTPEAP